MAGNITSIVCVSIFPACLRFNYDLIQFFFWSSDNFAWKRWHSNKWVWYLSLYWHSLIQIFQIYCLVSRKCLTAVGRIYIPAPGLWQKIELAMHSFSRHCDIVDNKQITLFNLTIEFHTRLTRTEVYCPCQWCLSVHSLVRPSKTLSMFRVLISYLTLWPTQLEWEPHW